jgi:hypothetical protein
MGKLRCLVLVLSWLGFIFLEKSLSVNHVVLALNKLQKGQLVTLWQKALPTTSVVIPDSESESGADLLNKEQTQHTSNLAFLLHGLPKLCKMISIIWD